jgi:hypothetical protein
MDIHAVEICTSYKRQSNGSQLLAKAGGADYKNLAVGIGIALRDQIARNSHGRGDNVPLDKSGEATACKTLDVLGARPGRIIRHENHAKSRSSHLSNRFIRARNRASTTPNNSFAVEKDNPSLCRH